VAADPVVQAIGGLGKRFGDDGEGRAGGEESKERCDGAPG
jgi:hypothetical protein